MIPIRVIQPIAILHSAGELHFVLDGRRRCGAAAVILAKRIVYVVFRAIECAVGVRPDDVRHAAAGIVMVRPVLPFRLFRVVYVILPFARDDGAVRIQDVFIRDVVGVAIGAERQRPTHVEIHGVVAIGAAAVRLADPLSFSIVQAGVQHCPARGAIGLFLHLDQLVGRVVGVADVFGFGALQRIRVDFVCLLPGLVPIIVIGIFGQRLIGIPIYSLY